MTTNRGSVEIMLLFTISLLILLVSQQFNRCLIVAQLLRDHVQALNTTRHTINQVLGRLSSETLDGRSSDPRCITTSESVGRIRQSFSLCYLQARDDKPRPLINYHSHFLSVTPCPPPHQRAPNDATPRSFFQCQFSDHTFSKESKFSGDLSALGSSRFKEGDNENLLSATGSLYFDRLQISAKTSIIALGDIVIENLISDSKQPLHLTVLAPQGTVIIRNVFGIVTLSFISKANRLAKALVILPWATPAALSSTEQLPLGLFLQPLN